MKPIEKDHIIVGQGIAGSLLAFALLEKGKRVLMIDNAHYEASSVVAGGDVNPITGQRFVKSWKQEDLRAAMLPMYAKVWQAAENDKQNTNNNTSFFDERPILRVLHNAKEHNDWQARSAWEAWQGYIGDTNEVNKADFEADFGEYFALAKIEQGGKVDLKNVLDTIKSKLEKCDSLFLEKFKYSELQIQADGVIYTTKEGLSIFAKNLIFCEGWQAIANPWFNYLPFQLSKGEALLIKIAKDYKFGQYIVKNDLMFSHLYEDIYWVGATNSFDFVTANPTENGRAELENRLQIALKTPFEIVEHRACLRPTVKDRRPLVGQHPVHSNLYILNGLGTKGASLAPYLVVQLMAFLEKNEVLDSDIDICRYAHLFGESQKK
jgi:glycine oxidase